jgi:hypothetical protein
MQKFNKKLYLLNVIESKFIYFKKLVSIIITLNVGKTVVMLSNNRYQANNKNIIYCKYEK